MIGVASAGVKGVKGGQKVDRLDEFLVNTAVWVLLALLWTLVFGAVSAVVAAVSGFLSADLQLFIVVRGVVTNVGIVVLTAFLVLNDIHSLRSGYSARGPDLVFTFLLVLDLILSLVAIPVSSVTRSVLLLSVVDAVLFFIVVMVQVKTNDNDDYGEYLLGGVVLVRWWRVLCVGLFTALFLGLFLAAGGFWVPSDRVPILTDYTLIGLFWAFVWLILTVTGSILCGGTEKRR